MPVNWTTNKQFISPSAAAGLSITPSGSAWASSAYTQITAATDTNWVLTGAVVGTPGAAVEFELDIATGAAASEVVIATFKGKCSNATLVFDRGSILLLPIPIDAIGGGVRVSMRMRVSTTSVAAWTFAITYIKHPVVGNLLVSTQIVRVTPSAAVMKVIALSAGSWANSTWTEFIAAAPAGLVLIAIAFAAGAAGMNCEVDIGLGAAGSENVITIWRVSATTTTSGSPNYQALPNPNAFTPVGARLAIRWRNLTNTGAAPALAIHYQYQPL